MTEAELALIQPWYPEAEWVEVCERISAEILAKRAEEECDD